VTCKMTDGADDFHSQRFDPHRQISAEFTAHGPMSTVGLPHSSFECTPLIVSQHQRTLDASAAPFQYASTLGSQPAFERSSSGVDFSSEAGPSSLQDGYFLNNLFVQARGGVATVGHSFREASLPRVEATCLSLDSRHCTSKIC